MADAKVKITIGGISFTGEGEESWATAQLDKILNGAPELLKTIPIESPISTNRNIHNSSIKPENQSQSNLPDKTLASFLSEHNATVSQVKKFLATALWLTKYRGKNRMETKDITAALKNSYQSRLGNPADSLNQNVKKGFCEKDGDVFFVTSEGENSITG